MARTANARMGIPFGVPSLTTENGSKFLSRPNVAVPLHDGRSICSPPCGCAARYSFMAKEIPHPTDKHVGSRVRMRRMMVGLSLAQLGRALGLSYQQVQKYENGQNRVSASRLKEIGHILGASASFFFDGG